MDYKKNIRKVIKKIFESKKTKIQYVAASVEEDTEINKILNKLQKIINNLPDGWVITSFPNGKYDFHMTIRCCKPLEFYSKKELINKVVILKFNAIGVSDKAIALKEVSNVYSDNDVKHVTIAFNKGKGGLPVDSNNINKWYKIKPFSVKAIIRQFDYNDNIVYDITIDERGSAINTGNFPNHSASAGYKTSFPY